MDLKLYFFLIFFITILVTRVFLYVHPTPSPTINGFRTHHYMYGLIYGQAGYNRYKPKPDGDIVFLKAFNDYMDREKGGKIASEMGFTVQ